MIAYNLAFDIESKNSSRGYRRACMRATGRSSVRINASPRLIRHFRLANSSIENLTQAQATLKEELDCATAQLQSLRREFDEVLQSLSWRYTAIFRRITQRGLGPGLGTWRRSRQW